MLRHLPLGLCSLLPGTTSKPPVPVLRAAVYEITDRWSKAQGAALALKTAGFEVERILPATWTPGVELDLVVIGAFASEDAAYAGFVTRAGPALRKFVQRGGCLLQLTQADQTEKKSPFLPAALEVQRCDNDLDEIWVLDRRHPITRKLPRSPGHAPDKFVIPRHLGRPGSWESLCAQKGMRVLLAADPDGRYPALVEGADGKGRFLVSSFFLDKLLDGAEQPIASAALVSASRGFFRALAGYVRLVRSGNAPDVVPTPPWQPKKPLPFVPGSWTLVVLPDTQIYAWKYPAIFSSQTKWIVDNRSRFNIRFVLHVGDVVNNNNDAQWKNARTSMALLDGKVPYVIAPGNHDYGPNGSATDRTTLFNKYFPASLFTSRKSFGGSFDKVRMDNTWHVFDTGAGKWLVLALEFAPRDQVVAWADTVLRGSTLPAIVVTHAYTYSDDSRYDHATRTDQLWGPHQYGLRSLPGGVNDAEEMWQKTLFKHANMRFVLSGHVLNDGRGRLSSMTKAGSNVHQILGNYQMNAWGGEGYLRLMEFLPDGKQVQVKTYSPWRDSFETDSQNQFVLTL